jgi:hypothetical protein
MTTSTDHALPTVHVSIACGACGDELEHDGDNLQCYSCKLEYPSDPFSEEPAEYFFKDDKPCGAAPREREQRWNRPFRTEYGVVTQQAFFHTVLSDCSLPTDHSSDHHHPRTTTRELVAV